MNNIDSLRFFWPESVLTVAVMALLVQDLAVRKSARRVQWLTGGALFWLALTAWATWMTPRGNLPIFGGLLMHDPLRMFFAWLFLAATLLTIIIVPRSAQISVARMGEFLAKIGKEKTGIAEIDFLCGEQVFGKARDTARFHDRCG